MEDNVPTAPQGNPPAGTPDRLSVQQVADLLGWTTKTLRNRMARHNGSAPEAVKRPGSNYFIEFELSTVSAWLATRKSKKAK